jgi:protein-tyrosine kinase
MNTAFRNRSEAESTPSQGIRLLLGRQLLDDGKLTELDVGRIVEAQKKTHLRFGETAIKLGLLNERDLQIALARQYGYPCASSPDTGFSRTLFAASEPFGRQSEALRSLRSQLLMRWFDDRKKAIAITAVGPGKNGSHLAANLAVSFAQLGERILLIDANMRNPQQHSLFGLGATAGLSSLLNGRCDVEEVLTPVPSFENMAVICAGAVPPNPQELLSRVSFSYLVETAPALFDIIIIDTPPVLEFADAQLVSTLVGGCVLSARRHQTRVADIEEIKRRFNGSRAEIVGAVVLD